jgi:molecular chaperone IbpA
MTRTYTFNTTTPWAIGFETLLDRFNDSHNSNVTNYPPYNIIKLDDANWCIELAVAGFSRKDIDIELGEGVLVVSGKIETKEKEIEYVHRGLAQRAFTRKWTLSEDVIVRDASLLNGLLVIRLERVIPEEKKPRKIQIS